MTKKILGVFFLGVGTLVALQARAVAINVNLPGTSQNTSIGGMISNIYQFSLIAAGILAFGAIVYGGIRYATGRGNPSEESDARSRIWNALLGLLLLAGAYIILYTINPNLVQLSLPNINQPATQNNTTGSQSCGTCGGSCNGTCPSGQTCAGTMGGGYTCQGGTQPGCSGTCGGGCNGTCPQPTQSCSNLGYGYVCV